MYLGNTKISRAELELQGTIVAVPALVRGYHALTHNGST